jgi:chromatin remodeling complex protein RSC6
MAKDRSKEHNDKEDGGQAPKKRLNPALMKPVQPSNDLAQIVGSTPMPRSEITKKVWEHIKKNNLQNPQNKREILADDKLERVFGTKKLSMFEMTKAINRHVS